MKEALQKGWNWIREHSTLLKFIFLGSVLLFVINQMTQILQGMTWSELAQVLAAQKLSTLCLMTLIGLVAVLPMLVYDWVTVEVLEENGQPVMSRRELFLSAWTTNTINNLAGFGGVIGATLRAKFYSRGASTRKVVATVSKVAVFMLSGLSILCFFTFIDVFFLRTANPFRNYWIWLLGGSFVAPVLFIVTRLKKEGLFFDFPVKRVLKIFLGSFGQWSGAMVTFLLIGYLLQVPIQVTQVYPLFVAATLIGMISMVPGGMGTFDVLMIIGLGQLGVAREVAVAWLLYYRIFYYLLPFFTGIILFLTQTGTKLNAFFDGIPKLFAQKVAHFLLTAMVYFAGVMMVLLATVPNLSNISSLFQKLLPFSFDFLDQTFNMLIGFLLLGLARGVANRVKKAYWPTILVLAFCIMNTISRTVNWKLLVFYVILLACLYLARKEFYRKQLVFSFEAQLFDGALYGVLFVLYAVVGYYSTNRLKHGEVPANFLLFPSEDVWLAGLVGLILAAVTIIILYRYLSSGSPVGTEFDRRRLEWLVQQFGPTEYTQYNLLLDKRNFYYQEDGWDKVVFTFEKQADKLFVLGNPVGDKAYFKVASQVFAQYADERGYQLVFFGIDATYALLLRDLGYAFLKVGEVGQVQCRSTTTPQLEPIEVKVMSSQDFFFQYYEQITSSELLDELEKVSDEWLQGKREKGFVTGRFRRTYLKETPLGIVFGENRAVMGFITFKTDGNGRLTGYDLLRYKTSAPAATPAFLLEHGLVTAQQQGCQVFHLGFAPFSGVGESETAFMPEKLLQAYYKYSQGTQGLKELYQLKANYATDWQASYVALPTNAHALVMLGQLFLLIERGGRRNATPVEAIRQEEWV